MKKSLFLRYALFSFISLFTLFFAHYDVNALTFDSISVRTAYFYENGTLSDSDFVSTNPRNLPQYYSTSIGAVSMRLFQWRYSTDSPLEKGRYKISTDITFSSLEGNDIVNFLNPTFDEFGCGTNHSNASPSNCILVDYNTKEINDTKFQFNYTIDLLNDNCNFFNGIFKYYDQEYNNFTIVNLYGTENATLSYSTSFQKLASESNDDIIDNQNKNTQDVINNNNTNTDNIINNNNTNTDNIINNQDSNTQDIIDNQNKNNEELKDTINDTFNTCRPSVNLIDFGSRTYVSGGITHTITNNSISSSGTATSGSSNIGDTNYFFTLSETIPAGTYTFSRSVSNGYRLYIRLYDESKSSYEQFQITANSPSVTFTLNSPKKYFYVFYAGWSSGDNIDIKNVNLQLEKGSISTPFEQPNQEICTNKLDEQAETSRGILGTLKNVFTSIVELPGKIVNLLVDGLKSLFVPDSNEMNNLINNFKNTMSEKLGVIYQAGDLLVGIFQNIIDDKTPENACLTFPELKLPNVDKPIISQTPFCFSDITNEIPILLTTIRGITGVFITITFVNMLKKKYDDFINGGDM